MQGEPPTKASTPIGAVFLSYASQDAGAAQRICEALRAAGIEVWFDQSELRGGDAWDYKIRDQIQDCRLFIPVISASTERRDEGYFRREWSLAVDRTRDMIHKRTFLVPVAIDSTPERGAAVPEKFHELQWTRLPDGQTPPAFVDRIGRLLTPDAPPATTAATGSTRGPIFAPPGRRSTLSKAAIWGACAIAAGTCAYFIVNEFWLAKHTVPPALQATLITTQTTSGAGAVADFNPPPHSIAVLPFVDMSETHDQEYFGDGTAEEILTLLVRVPDLKVIGRTSSFQLTRMTDDLRKIGTVLGVAYLVKGSVRRSGDHIRVTAQLIDTRDGMHRWSEKYDRNADDAMRVQEEIATSVVRALELEVSPSMDFGLRSKPKDRAVYDLYLRGLHAADRFNLDGWEEAVVDFRRVLELDSSFVPAAEALTESLMLTAGFALVPEQSGWRQVREAAEATLRLDPKSAIAHAALANVHLFNWDWTAAERELTTAVALAPHNPSVLIYAADGRLIVGQWAEAVQFLDAARAVDPLHPSVYEWSCYVYPMLGRVAEAEQACRRALEISPTYTGGAYNLGLIQLMQGKAEVALTQMQEVTDPGDHLAGLALAYHALHRSRDAEAALVRLTAEHAEDMPMSIADVYAFRGQNNKALQWLDKAYTRRDHNLVYIKSDLLLKNLAHDPDYKAILHKMNLPE